MWLVGLVKTAKRSTRSTIILKIDTKTFEEPK
jgi:hypothetical protein